MRPGPLGCALLMAVMLGGTAVSARGEAYVAGYVGGARTRASTVVLDQPGRGVNLILSDVPFRGRAFESPVYYGYRAGYYFTRHFGIEGEFIHLKTYANLEVPVAVQGSIGGTAVRENAPMSRYASQFEVSHGLNLVLINAVFRRPLWDNRLALLARAGAGPTVPRPEVNVFGSAGGSYQAGPVAAQGAAGIDARLWRGFRVLAEYKYTFTPTSFDIPNGTARFHVHSHHLVTGLAVHF